MMGQLEHNGQQLLIILLIPFLLAVVFIFCSCILPLLNQCSQQQGVNQQQQVSSMQEITVSCYLSSREQLQQQQDLAPGPWLLQQRQLDSLAQESSARWLPCIIQQGQFSILVSRPTGFARGCFTNTVVNYLLSDQVTPLNLFDFKFFWFKKRSHSLADWKKDLVVGQHVNCYKDIPDFIRRFNLINWFNSYSDEK